jgi:phage tail-like protein
MPDDETQLDIAGTGQEDDMGLPIGEADLIVIDNSTFRLIWEGRHVAGVRRVGHLRRATQVVVHQDGADPTSERKIPGRTTFDPVTIELGLIHDPNFEAWASDVASFQSEGDGQPFRRDVTIEVYDEADQLVVAYQLFRCWVSEYQALPDLDANANAVVVQHLTLENEGWEKVPDLP